MIVVALMLLLARSQLLGMLRAEDEVRAKLSEVESIACRVHGFVADQGCGTSDCYCPRSKVSEQDTAFDRPEVKQIGLFSSLSQ